MLYPKNYERKNMTRSVKEIALRAAKKEARLQADILLAQKFCKEIIIPALALKSKRQSTVKEITLREITLKFKKPAADAFKIMFFPFQRGGLTKEGVPFKSTWALNESFNVCRILADWAQEENSTIRELLELLETAQITKLKRKRCADGVKRILPAVILAKKPKVKTEKQIKQEEIKEEVKLIKKKLGIVATPEEILELIK